MPLHIFPRQIDATGGSIPRDVLPEVDELQSRTDGVGLLLPQRILAASQGQHDPADGVRRATAVVTELVASFVANHLLILHKGIKQVMKGLTAQLVALHRLRKGHKDRMLRMSLTAGVEFSPPRIKSLRRRPRALGLISEIVAPAGKRIDIGKILPQ